MFSKDALSERERGLENEFFYKVDQKLLADLRERIARQQAISSLAASGHISDEKLLDELVTLGVKPENLAAVNLIPLVLVAWADHRIAEKERLTVVQAAIDAGGCADGPVCQLLEHWLKIKPSKELRETWAHYVRVVAQGLTPDARVKLKHSVMHRARAVAKAAHGILGFGIVSAEEAKILDEMEATFDAA